MIALCLALALVACEDGARSSMPSETPADETPPTTPEPNEPEAPVDILAIQWGEEPLQRGELYLPNPASEPLTPIVMIHGGCWQSSYTLELQSALSEALALRGYAVWNIEYRSLGSGGEWPVMFQDVAKAADYLKTIASMYPLELDRTVAMGHSAGGHLALWLAGRETITPSSVLYTSELVPIQGSITLGGIGDLTSGACGSASAAIIAGADLSETELQERLQAASPIHMLPIFKPTILISGASDGIVPPSLSENYSMAALTEGDPSQHIVVEGAGHFYLINPELLNLNIIDNAIDSILGL